MDSGHLGGRSVGNNAIMVIDYSRRRDGATYSEERVDDVVLTHQYGTEKVGYDDRTNVLGIHILGSDQSSDQNRNIGNEDHTKESAIQ